MSEINPPDLRKHPFFSGMPDGLRGLLQGCLLKWELPPGAIIVRRGERSGFLAIVGQGRVELEKADGSFQVSEASGAFGEAMLRYGVPSAYTARAITPTVLWILWRSDWLAIKRDFTDALITVKDPLSVEQPKKKNFHKPRKIGKLHLGCWIPPIVLALVIYFLGSTLLAGANHTIVDFATKAQRPDLAVEYLQFALQWQPDTAELHDALGCLLFGQGNLPGALLEFQQAVQQDENLAVARNNLGVVLLDQGQAQEAISQLEAAIDLDPSNADAYTNLGDAYLAAGNLEEAADSYQRAFELDPSQLEARARWAGIALEEGKLDQARKTWEEVVEANPRIIQAQRGLGVIAVLQEHPIDALLYLEAARLIDPSDAVVYIYIGLALEALNRPKEATEEYTQALTLSNDPALVEWVRGRLDVLKQQSPLGDANKKGGATSVHP